VYFRNRVESNTESSLSDITDLIINLGLKPRWFCQQSEKIKLGENSRKILKWPKTFEYKWKKKTYLPREYLWRYWVVFFQNAGGAGNQTRVQKKFHQTSICLSRLLNQTVKSPAGRFFTAVPSKISLEHTPEIAYRPAHLNWASE